jgi:hypothetical protein
MTAKTQEVLGEEGFVGPVGGAIGTLLDKERAALVFVFHWGEAVDYHLVRRGSMKRLTTVAAAAAMLVAGTGSATHAQDMDMGMTPAARTPVFELGLYGGYSYTTPWFSINDESYKPGSAPIFGADATLWASPRWGVRVHGAYFPSKLPENSGNSAFDSYSS